MHSTGYTIVREPKGGPDAVLFGYAKDLDRMARVANILSVQGYTCRILQLQEPLKPSDLSVKDRQNLFPAGIPALDAAAFDDSTDMAARKIAKAIQEAMQQ